ncbi:MAG TPA: branched-chain amino acid ABC transporter permease [Chloroflexia bacterium]|nr:branched-chain amino acid ABC transporter permease [Chloroflexia bacterium]
MPAPLFQVDPLVTFGQALVNGLAFGSIYALAALSLVLIFKASDVVNFANGEMAMFSAFISFVFLDTLNMPYWVAFLGALAFAALLGAGTEVVLIRPLRNAGPLNQVMVTIGLGTLLTGLAGWIWNFEGHSFPDPIKGAPLRAGSIIIKQADLLRMGVAVGIALLLFLFFRYTLVGTALRGMAQNPTAARLMGVNVGRMTTLTWAMATMLGAIAGMLIAPSTFLEPLMMADVAVKAFAAAVLGGFTSLPGAVVGGLALGIVDNMVGTYLSQDLRSTFAFAIIIGVLVIRPNGLLGRTVKKKV